MAKIVQNHAGEDDEDFDDPEGLDDGDVDDGDSVDTEPCPYCRKRISEYAEVCPICGNYVSGEDAPAGRKPAWMVVCVAVLLIVIVVCWVLSKPQPQ